MKKLLLAATAAAVGFGLCAEEGVSVSTTSEATGGKTAEVEEQDDRSWEAGVDVDLFSAYVWRSAFSTDRPVIQPCVWADWTFCDPFSLGFYVWQNYDLTNRRRHDGVRGEWNETDYNVHLGTTLWSSEDEEISWTVETGHEWYTYCIHGSWEDGSRKRKDWPTTYEWYLKTELENPYVTPYAQCSWEYLRVHGMYVELGVKKEQTLADLFSQEGTVLEKFSVFADWNVNGGSARYLTYLYAPRYRHIAWNEDDGEWEYDEDRQKTGLGGTTVKVGLSWAPCDCFSCGFVLAYTAILNSRCADGLSDGVKLDEVSTYADHDQLVWGGFQAHFSF